MSIELVNMWHQRARPDPEPIHLNIQTGCHLEECMEMLAVMTGDDEYSATMLDRLHTALTTVSLGLKNGTVKYHVKPGDRAEFLDSLCDQIVTAVGVGHCAKMNVVEGVRRVNSSNWTKLVDDKFVYNEHGKIIKPPSYKPPDLKGLF